MRAAAFGSVSGTDIRVFSKEELLSLRDETDKEPETREKEKEKRTPLDLSARQAGRDVCCPACGCHRHCDDGVHNGRQRILCSQCGTGFGCLSGKMTDKSKLSLMRVYQPVMFFTLDLPIWAISYLPHMDQKTIQLWRHRLSDVADKCPEKAVLSDRIWIGETYWRLTGHGMIRVRPDGKPLRGLSRNPVCALVGYDIRGSCFCHVMHRRGKPDSDGVCSVLKGNIRPGSDIIHDGAEDRRYPIDSLRLKETVVKSTDSDKSRRALMLPIDNVCALLKFEVHKHRGISTGHMAELLPWFLPKATELSRCGVHGTVDRIMTLLFGAGKTEGYYEKFHMRRKIKKVAES